MCNQFTKSSLAFACLRFYNNFMIVFASTFNFQVVDSSNRFLNLLKWVTLGFLLRMSYIYKTIYINVWHHIFTFNSLYFLLALRFDILIFPFDFNPLFGNETYQWSVNEHSYFSYLNNIHKLIHIRIQNYVNQIKIPFINIEISLHSAFIIFTKY